MLIRRNQEKLNSVAEEIGWCSNNWKSVSMIFFWHRSLTCSYQHLSELEKITLMEMRNSGTVHPQLSDKVEIDILMARSDT